MGFVWGKDGTGAERVSGAWAEKVSIFWKRTSTACNLTAKLRRHTSQLRPSKSLSLYRSGFSGLYPFLAKKNAPESLLTRFSYVPAPRTPPVWESGGAPGEGSRLAALPREWTPRPRPKCSNGRNEMSSRFCFSFLFRDKPVRRTARRATLGPSRVALERVASEPAVATAQATVKSPALGKKVSVHFGGVPFAGRTSSRRRGEVCSLTRR